MAKHIFLTANKYGVQPIIFYQPHLYIQEDTLVKFNTDEASLNKLASACAANNIVFVDMTETFLEKYKTEHVLPHGFCNTVVGVGHLNRYGHAAIAEKLTSVIKKLDEEKAMKLKEAGK